MQKLLAAFVASNSLKNAKALVAYVRKHFFVLCFMSAENVETLKAAERVIDDASRYGEKATAELLRKMRAAASHHLTPE